MRMPQTAIWKKKQQGSRITDGFARPKPRIEALKACAAMTHGPLYFRWQDMDYES